LLVRAPASYAAERRYILSVLLGERLGLDWRLLEHEDPVWQIVRAGDDVGAATLVLPDVLFQTEPRDWLTAAVLPPQPLRRLAIPQGLAPPESRELPVIFGRSLEEPANGDPWLGVETPNPGRRAHCGIDLFGAAFFLLTRYEEVVVGDRDRHGRFPAWASLAHQEGFLDRPLVDEMVELLAALVNRLWPGSVADRSAFRVRLSHDVDWPLGAAGLAAGKVVGSCAADLVRRRDGRLAWRRWWAFLRNDPEIDPLNTFDQIMQWSEGAGVRSAFYFIAERTAGSIDGAYAVEDPWIRALMRRVHQRGHEIGLHPSYGSYRDPCQIRWEFERLRAVCREEGIDQQTWGGRQHFLRWENPTTWRGWEGAGLDYDSTLTFPEVPGFRCGTCHEYQVFDLQARQALRLRERPLIVMEGSLRDYQRLRWSPAVEEILRLAEICRRHRGDFTLLWHNSMLASAREKASYRSVIRGLSGG
jgi:hypothetical protein